MEDAMGWMVVVYSERREVVIGGQSQGMNRDEAGVLIVRWPEG
jgi:hypothetical protein